MSKTIKTSYTGLEAIDRTTLVEVLNVALAADRPLFIWASPGVGKSDTVRDVAADNGYVVVDVRAAHMPPEDFAGIAWPNHETKRVERYMPDVVSACWRAHEDNGKPVILFLDEMGQLPSAVQGALYSIVLDRQAAGYDLPPGTRIVAAGNPEGTGSISEDMSRALLDRGWNVEYAGPTPAEFDAYALKTGMHAIVRAFLADHPDQINAFDPEEQVSPTPRSWKALSNVLNNTNSLPLMMQAANGHVGVAVGQQFAAYVEMFGQLPRFVDIVADPKNAQMPEAFAARYMTALSLVSGLKNFWELEHGRYISSTVTAEDKKARADVHTAVVLYLLRLPTELQSVALASIAEVKPSTNGTTNGTTQGTALLSTMFSDFRAADPTHAELYKQLAGALRDIYTGLDALSIK